MYNHHTKESIYQRMQQSALNFWNIKSADELDPMVRMLMEALSVELYSLSTENQNAQQRMLDRVAQMMVPEFMTAPQPARALMHAKSIEPQDILQKEHHFFLYKKEERVDGSASPQIEVCFTPVRAVKISQCQPQILLNGQYLFQYNAQLIKQQAIPVQIPQLLQTNTLWLGLSDNRTKVDVTHLSFYFKIGENDDARQRLLYALPMVKCVIGNKAVPLQNGVIYQQETATGLMTRLDILQQLEEDVIHYYDPYFLSINAEIILHPDHKTKTPFENNAPLQAQLQPHLRDDLHWVGFEFPPSVSQQDLQHVEILTNVFPCVNRKLKELRQKLPAQSRIIPLRNDNLHEQFLAIHSVSDEENQYQPSQYLATTDQSGLFSIVQGGIEKFDERNAKEHIQHLLELLRSESAAFASMGYDFVASSLRELQQKMTLIEQKTAGITQTGMETDHYLMIQPSPSPTHIYAEYWLTTGTFANGIRSESKLQARRHTLTANDNIFLLQTTHAGKNRPKGTERLNAFRSALLSRNTLITKQDIRLFCEMELNSQANVVDISPGYAFREGAGANYHRTIDITLQPLLQMEVEEWQQKLAQLKAQLQTRSSMHYQYRLVLQ